MPPYKKQRKKLPSNRELFLFASILMVKINKKHLRFLQV